MHTIHTLNCDRRFSTESDFQIELREVRYDTETVEKVKGEVVPVLF
jgi:hypothetical protein